jgi:hypothetical protein
MFYNPRLQPNVIGIEVMALALVILPWLKPLDFHIAVPMLKHGVIENTARKKRLVTPWLICTTAD